MKTNTLKNQADEIEEEKTSERLEKNTSLFTPIEKLLRFDSYFIGGFPVRNMSKIIFVATLSLIYIGNTHYAEKTIREIGKKQIETEDLRADYTTLKAEVMLAGKQSEVAKRVKSLGLEEANTAPFKIITTH